MLHGSGSRELFFEQLAGQAICMARTLHYRAAWRGFAAHEERHSDHAFIAHDGDLRGSAVRHDIQQRYDRSRRKINMAQQDAGLVQHIAQRHDDQLQMRQQPFKIRGRERGQQMVLLEVMSFSHAMIS